MKITTGTYSTADMMEDWVMHSVSSGNAGSRDWIFGHSVVDASGNSTFSQMMGGGMMTSTFHGIMNEGRNIIVSTYSDGSGGYPFSIQVK